MGNGIDPVLTTAKKGGPLVRLYTELLRSRTFNFLFVFPIFLTRVLFAITFQLQFHRYGFGPNRSLGLLDNRILTSLQASL
jgi:hypothetical protein